MRETKKADQRALSIRMEDLRAPKLAEISSEREKQQAAQLQQAQSITRAYECWCESKEFQKETRKLLREVVAPALLEVAKRNGSIVILKKPSSDHDYLFPSDHSAIWRRAKEGGEQAIIDSDFATRVCWQGSIINSLVAIMRAELQRFCNKNALFAAVIQVTERIESYDGWHRDSYLELWFSDRSLAWGLTRDRTISNVTDRVAEDRRLIKREMPHKGVID